MKTCRPVGMRIKGSCNLQSRSAHVYLQELAAAKVRHNVTEPMPMCPTSITIMQLSCYARLPGVLLCCQSCPGWRCLASSSAEKTHRRSSAAYLFESVPFAVSHLSSTVLLMAWHGNSWITMLSSNAGKQTAVKQTNAPHKHDCNIVC